MTYQVRFTDPSKSLIVEDQTLNTQTSISLVGKQYLNYATAISENFLHLLENFAYNRPPLNPVQGQLWYDNSLNVNYLKVYNGKNWEETSFIKKATETPNTPAVGDLWVDYNNQQLKMFTGGSTPTTDWIVIGPSLGSKETGVDVTTITDNNSIPNSYPIISLYTNEKQIAIISESTFVPQQELIGFSKVNKGITLFKNGADEIKLYGTATQADALVVSNEIINSSQFLRKDTGNTTLGKFEIENDSGLVIGSSSDFIIEINSSSNTELKSTVTSGNTKNINIGFTSNSQFTPVIRVQSTGNVGIGSNSSELTKTLNVFGDAHISGELTVNNNLIVNGRIKEDPVLPAISEIDSFNNQNRYIGRLEITSESSPAFLTGVWVGVSAVSTVVNSAIIPSLENVIMVITEDNQVGITGWLSKVIIAEQINTTLERFDAPAYNQTTEKYTIAISGKLTRIRPFVYFYSKDSSIPNETGCVLQSVLVNKAGNIANLAFLSKKKCANTNILLKNATLYKMSDDVNEFSTIYEDIRRLNDQWVPV